MRDTLSDLVISVIQMGGPGVFLIAALDSSFLFLPLGVDLLVISLSTGGGLISLYFAAMAGAGSVLGTALVYELARRGGEAGFSRLDRQGGVEKAKRFVEKHSRWALTAAALMPPPFPYTMFVAAASALSYSRTRLLLLTGIGRFVRFWIEAEYGALYGEQMWIASGEVSEYRDQL